MSAQTAHVIDPTSKPTNTHHTLIVSNPGHPQTSQSHCGKCGRSVTSKMQCPYMGCRTYWNSFAITSYPADATPQTLRAIVYAALAAHPYKSFAGLFEMVETDGVRTFVMRQQLRVTRLSIGYLRYRWGQPLGAF